MSEVIPSRLTFIRKSDRITRRRHLYDWYKCTCGVIKEIRRDAIERGLPVSCGCYQREAVQKRASTHGQSKTLLYGVWRSMKSRCNDPNFFGFSDYGGRGIRVCDRWQGEQGFANFLADMGERPSPKHSIDRKDNEGPYSPENCHWATDYEQKRNTRATRNLTHNGRTMCLTDWARELGMTQLCLWSRIVRRGWSVERALTTPPDIKYSEKRQTRRGTVTPPNDTE